jgi:hypothetical protein
MFNQSESFVKPQEVKHDEQQKTPRTPGRKLVKEDLATTSVLIRGTTFQTCCKVCPTATGDYK